MKFRKKPIEIEAIQWDGTSFFCAGNLPDWLPEVQVKGGLVSARSAEAGEINRHGETLYIGTLEGVMEAQDGDWIIRGIKGELYPCKPDIFDATYEAVL